MLFKKFSTIKGNFMKTNEYGSGLGLYISRLLADGMDGKIQLDKSASGGGSEFSAFFPIAPVKPKD